MRMCVSARVTGETAALAFLWISARLRQSVANSIHNTFIRPARKMMGSMVCRMLVGLMAVGSVDSKIGSFSMSCLVDLSEADGSDLLAEGCISGSESSCLCRRGLVLCVLVHPGVESNSVISEWRVRHLSLWSVWWRNFNHLSCGCANSGAKAH